MPTAEKSTPVTLESLEYHLQRQDAAIAVLQNTVNTIVENQSPLWAGLRAFVDAYLKAKG